MRINYLVILLGCVLIACKQQKKNNTIAEPNEFQSGIKYAEGFTVKYFEGYKLVEVKQPYQGSTSGYTYVLVEHGNPVPQHITDAKVIHIPISTIVCTSTTHIPLLDYLDESESLIGFPSLNYISSERMRELIDQGSVAELGIDKGMNLERIATLQPDMVMGYTMTGDLGQFKKIENLNIPVVINAEYLEKHPLGRAEWIKFMALFFNKEKLADSIFSAIEWAYMATRKLTAESTKKPTVFSGVVYGDTWFMPGGQNYAAQLLRDAGYDYLWSSTDSNGYLELSFELVYEQARDADFWIGVASFTSLKEIEAADNRYAKFKAFHQGNVFTYDARKGAKGGSEFLELGYLRPDWILQDLVKIAHPELLPEYTPYFHKQLK